MLIFASVMNVPMAGIAYDPKIKGFMEYMKQKNYVELNDFSFDLFDKVLGDVVDNEETLSEQLKTELIPLREKAKQNAFMALELLES